MDPHSFDRKLRSLHGPASRRGVVQLLSALGLWELLGHKETVAKRKRRKKNKKKRKNKNGQGSFSPPPPPPPPFPCTPACAGKVCGDDGCGSSCGACGAGQLCALGTCVTGQGTCAAGDDICVDPDHRCNSGSAECLCMTSMSNQTRCGIRFTLSGCGTCLSDAECAAANPGVEGVFCQKRTADCACGGACFVPCPSD